MTKWTYIPVILAALTMVFSTANPTSAQNYQPSQVQVGQTDRQVPQPKGGIATVIGVDQPDNCLRIRSGPDNSYDVIGCANVGDQLNITGVWTSNDWAQLADNGWVYGPQIQTDLRPPQAAFSRRPRYVITEAVTPDYDDWAYLPNYGYDTYWYGDVPIYFYNAAVWSWWHPWWWWRGVQAWWWKDGFHGRRTWDARSFRTFAQTRGVNVSTTERANAASLNRMGRSTTSASIASSNLARFNANRSNITSPNVRRLNVNRSNISPSTAARLNSPTTRSRALNTTPSVRSFSSPNTARTLRNLSSPNTVRSKQNLSSPNTARTMRNFSSPNTVRSMRNFSTPSTVRSRPNVSSPSTGRSMRSFSVPNTIRSGNAGTRSFSPKSFSAPSSRSLSAPSARSFSAPSVRSFSAPRGGGGGGNFGGAAGGGLRRK